MAKAKRVVRRAWTKDDVRTMKTMAKATAQPRLWRQDLGYPFRRGTKSLPDFRTIFDRAGFALINEHSAQ
jgi:hypothetical protein